MLQTKLQSIMKDSFLEAEELRNILLQLPETLSDEEMDEMLRAGDIDNNGKFDLSELG